MKRIISALLILMMMIPPMVLPAEAASLVQADSVVRITTDKDVAAVGETVTVTVAFENIPACSAVDFGLVYDTEYLQQPTDSDVTITLSGLAKAKNAAGTIEERLSQELAGRQAVKVVAANNGNCLNGTSGTLFTVKFVVAKEAPAPGIPLEFVGSFNNLYSDKDMRNTIEVVNTHIATANPSKSVTSVSLAQAPTKTQYVQGQALNMEGGRLSVTYSDNTAQEVHLSLAKVTQYDFNALGTQTVKAEYAGKEVSFEIQTEESVFSSISIGQTPSTIEYIQGKTATLDKSGGVLLLHYTGGLVKTLDMTDASVTLTGYDKNQLGIQTIKVYYSGFETEYKIVVVKKALSDIDVRTPMICDTCGLEQDAFKMITAAGGDPSSMNFNARLEYIKDTANNVTCLSETCEGTAFSTKMKMVYFLNEPFDVENAKLYVTYSDGTGEEIDMTLDMVDFNNGIATTQNVEVTYGAQEMLIKNVRTRKKEAIEISVKQKPKKLDYVQGQSFDPTGGIVTVKYDDGSEEEFSMGHEDVTIYYNALNSLGDHKITVFYGSQQTYFYIKVIARAVQSIAVDPEAKSTYVQGQELDPNTKLRVTYNDDKTETAYLKNATFTGYKPDQVGSQLVTVAYGKQECSWLVTVEEKVVTKLEIVGTPPTTILEGVDLNLENCTLTATYNDGEVVPDITITPAMIKNFNKDQRGAQTVTLAYEEGTLSFEITVLEKSLTAIEVEGVKEQYLLGDALDRSVGQIKLNYNNGSFDYIDFSDENVSAEGFRSDAEGQYTVTVGYQGLNDTYTVTVHREIREISVTAPAKTKYKEGEPLDLTGGVVHITYYNDTTDEQSLSLGMISGYDPNQPGEQTLTVEVGGATATFPVTVVAKVLERIEITNQPEKTLYIEGQPLDLSGMIIKAFYDNDTSEELDLQEVDHTEFVSTVGTKSITFEYEGKTTELTVTVIARRAESMEIITFPKKLTYVQGDALNFEDGRFQITYNDQTKSEILSFEKASVIGNTETIGTRPIYIQFENVQARIDITVIRKEVVKVEVLQEPNQTEYLEGKPLNLAGGMILVTYNNEKTEPLAMDAMGVTLSGYNPNQVGEQTVTVTYDEKSTTFKVHVRAKTATNIKVSTLPKTEYLEGKDTALNLAGGKLTVSYDNGTTQVIDLSAAQVSGFKKEIGTHTITVTYQGLQTSFHIEVRPKEISGIAIAAMPSKTLYRQGVEKFDPTGGLITVFYNNDTKETVNLSKAKISGFSNLFAGDVTVTAAYEGYAVEFKVMILAENPFKDVKKTDYFETPVLWAVTKEITNGMTVDSFAPNTECTRAQIVTFLWRAAGEPEPKSSKNPFKDVKKGEYYYKAVLWAVEEGITNGMDATHFAPDATCTRGQVATFLWRAEGEPAAANSKNPFKDLKKGEYYYNAVLWAVENGITNGMGDNKFAPNDTCTRGQIVTFLYRAYN